MGSQAGFGGPSQNGTAGGLGDFRGRYSKALLPRAAESGAGAHVQGPS